MTSHSATPIRRRSKVLGARSVFCLALVAGLLGQQAIAQPVDAPVKEQRREESLSYADVQFKGHGLVHRHFGDVVFGRSGKLIGAHRRASEHGVKAAGEIVYYTSKDGGRTVTKEAVLAASTSARDKRDVAMGTTRSGRILVAWTDTSVGKAGPTRFQIAFSDDEGVSWSEARTFATVPYSYARAYGTIKSLEGADGRSVLTIPAYFQTNNNPDFKVTMYRSHDGGETWVEGTPIFVHRHGSPDPVLTETDLAWLDKSNGFAVSRSEAGLAFFRTSDAGAGWTRLGMLAAGERAVAPAAYVFESEDIEYLLVFYCDRRSNTTRVRWTTVASLLENDVSGFSKHMKVLSPPDMVNASGYQKVAFRPDGTALMVEFREKDAGDRSSDVRLVTIRPDEWLKRSSVSKRPAR